MRHLCSFAFAFLALTAGAAPAWAFAVPDATVPTQHQLDLRDAANQPQPYAMSYSDEAAQRLGVRDGKWEAFNARSGDLMPSVRGGMDSGRPMISLQWRPGQ